MEKKVRVGIVGVGNMGGGHVKYIMRGKVPEMELCAICDIDPERIDYIHSLYPDIPAYSTAEEMYEKADIEAVIIATPHYDHPSLSIKALEAGLHVMCEKPAGVYTKQVLEMNEAAAKSDKVFEIMFCLRVHPVYRRVKQLIDSGELGNIKRVTWQVTNWYRPQSYHDSAGWRSSWATEGGGTLINQNPHQLDLWQWFFGMPEKIFADVSFGKYYNIEVDDDVTAIMKYKNGMTGIYETSTGENPGTNRLDISCDMGRVVVENDKIFFDKNEMSEREWNASGRTGEPAVTRTEIVAEGIDECHVGILKNFAAAILRGEKLIAPGEEGICELTLSNAMYYSTWTNGWADVKNFPHDDFYALLSERIKNSKPREKKFTGGYGSIDDTLKKK